jgi:putative toxin-antitoxin system antitoxin component (TIGR02293 family)
MVSTLPAAAELLGFKQKSQFDLHDAVLDGLPYSALTRFLKESGLPPKSVFEVLHIPPRTLARRKIARRLSRDESGHLQRLARLFKDTLDLFGGDAEAAAGWLMRPRPVLGNRKPIELAATEVGTEQVQTLIFQLNYGIVV